MCKKPEEVEIIINYPQRRGFILQAHKLLQELTSQFGLSGVLKEQMDEYFTVVLNGTTIYKKLTEDNSCIDHKKIIRAVKEYKQPLLNHLQETPQPDDSNDPDHIRWMNSACSGE